MRGIKAWLFGYAEARHCKKIFKEEDGQIQPRDQRDTECQWRAAGVSESTLLLVGGVSAATRSNGYTTYSIRPDQHSIASLEAPKVKEISRVGE